MVREGLRLGVVVAVLAWAAADLPLIGFLVVAGLLPAVWWGSGTWGVADPRVAITVSLVATGVAWGVALIGVMAGVDVRWEVALGGAVWAGTQLARVRLRPVRVDPVTAELWARQNAHLYRGTGPGGFVPDLTSTDPLAPLVGSRTRRPPADPYADVPLDHQLEIARSGKES